jgi:predicted negative regulator of RcsB-dependent stress response
MALDDLLDEHEQSERVRSWLRGNAAGLLGGIVLGLALIGGWQWWQKRHEAGLQAASDSYQAAIVAAAGGDLAKAKAAAAAVSGNETLSTLAALRLADAQVGGGQRDAAIATLRGVRVADPAMKDVVDTRMARLLVDAGKPADALSLLGGDPQSAAAIEARGDALAALDRDADARAAYGAALAKLDVAAPQRRLVELKLTGVGGTPARTEGNTP